jgi:hypothetical protein
LRVPAAAATVCEVRVQPVLPELEECDALTLDADAMGPVDVAVIGFSGDAFNGQIAPALRELVESDTVRIIDLVFIRKGAEGDTTVIEAMDEELDPAFLGLADDQHDLLSEEDLVELSQSLDPATAAMVIVWENRWASRFARAVRDSRGFLISQDRIPHEIVRSAVASLAE